MSNVNNVISDLEYSQTSIEKEMRSSYLDYAMSVIVSRAIPDVCDGLKPVHRRILYAMNESGCSWNRPYKKSARIVGEVMGKYHPHGDSAIYQSLVRMAQNFSLRVPLVDGQGNFGSIDGDSAAAMRYTESRMAKVSHKLLDDIDKDTVEFQDNYDGSEREPIVLPAKFPNLLVNGAGGIAVGMATNILPHNLGEVIDGTIAYIDNNDITDQELLSIIPGPDFPTGGIILGRAGSRSAVSTGRGSVIVRAKTNIEEIGKRQAIIITEIPYQVNKALTIEKIGQLVRDKKITGISSLRDESDKHGIRVVVELKKDANANVVLNQLFSYTQLQNSYSSNLLALDHGRPRLMSVREVISVFSKFRVDVVRKRTKYLLSKARNRAHILIGLSIAVANIDEIITLIKAAPDPSVAKEKLLEKAWKAENIQVLIELVADENNEVIDGKCYFTPTQAKAILDMKLSRLTGLEQEKINKELEELSVEIKEYLSILSSREKILNIIKTELTEIKEEFATPRLSSFEENEFDHDIEDLIPKEDMVVTVTNGGYIKRVPLSTYRAQRRGGRGMMGTSMHAEDAIVKMLVANTHTPILFFSNKGRVYRLKVHKLPLATRQSKGRSLINLFNLEQDETLNLLVPLPEDQKTWDEHYIFFATANEMIKKHKLADFSNIPTKGKIAITLKDRDRLVDVKIGKKDDSVFITSKEGFSVYFDSSILRPVSTRKSMGVKGMSLRGDNKIVSLEIVGPRPAILENVETRYDYLKIPVDIRLELKNLQAQLENLAEGESDEQIKENIDKALASIESEINHDDILELTKHEQFLVSITENGYGVKFSSYSFRKTNRGGVGVRTVKVSSKNGPVVKNFAITRSDQLMLITQKGQVIRIPIDGVRITGKTAAGVILFKIDKDDKIISAAKIEDPVIEEDDDEEQENAQNSQQAIDASANEVQSDSLNDNEAQDQDDADQGEAEENIDNT